MIRSNLHKKGGFNVLAEFFIAVQLEYSSILYTSTPVGEPVRRLEGRYSSQEGKKIPT
jgi:hypothetical protein